MQMNPNPPVKSGRRSRVSTEQKLSVLQQWQAGTPVAELCRLHGLKANAIYRWKKQLDHPKLNSGKESVTSAEFRVRIAEYATSPSSSALGDATSPPVSNAEFGWWNHPAKNNEPTHPALRDR